MTDEDHSRQDEIRRLMAQRVPGDGNERCWATLTRQLDVDAIDDGKAAKWIAWLKALPTKCRHDLAAGTCSICSGRYDAVLEASVARDAEPFWKSTRPTRPPPSGRPARGGTY